MGWMERLSRWRPSDEAAPLLAQTIMLVVVLGMAGCLIVMIGL